LDGGLQTLQCYAAGGGVENDGAGETGRKCVKDILAGVGCPVFTEQDRRLVGIHSERRCAGGVFLADAVKVFDRRAAVAAVDPLVASTELKP
jgi:hypothetical protein